MDLTHEAFLTQLVQALGRDAVVDGEAVPEAYRTDWSATPPVRPLALVLPRDTAQVAATLRLCHVHRVAVVPQGGRTGLAGGAVPRPHAIALCLERMHRIEELDAAAGTVTVQAGATLQSVQDAALAHGLLFGVDLGARGSCQIGGNIATNAGGNGVVQYGMVREQTLGLEVVLADGTVLDMLRPLVKNNTGYDLKQFFIGAEGTLGVVTRAVLRLWPAPAARATALVALPDYERALGLLGRIKGRFPGALAAFELMWRDFVQASLGWQQLREPFGQAHPLLALVDVVGADAPALQDALEAALGDAMEEGQALDVVIAQSVQQARQLWKIREATAEFPARLQPPVNFDISLPAARIGEFTDRCRALLDARWPRHHTLFFGHIGDCNLHVTTDGASIGGAADALEALVYDQVAHFRGSVSAEHGIGLHKKAYLGASRTPQEMAVMRSIRQALDPLGLMNPGKIFD